MYDNNLGYIIGYTESIELLSTVKITFIIFLYKILIDWRPYKTPN